MTLLDSPAVPSVPAQATPPDQPSNDASATAVASPNSVTAAVLLRSAAAAALSTASAAWVLASIFRGITPDVLAMCGVVLGVGGVLVSHRTRHAGLLQWAILPIALVLGALLVLPDAHGQSVPHLVSEALRNGGLAQAPAPFDPGWRFLLLTFVTGLAAGTTAVAVDLARPQLAAFMPAPLVLAGLLLQPASAGFVPTLVGVVLLIAAVAVSVGADFDSEHGRGAWSYELRRLLKSAIVTAALGAGLVALNAFGLFSSAPHPQVIPPQRPPKPPAVADHVLFTVDAATFSPWRLGVLDVYQDNAWMTPPFDPATLRTAPDRDPLRVDPADRVPTAKTRTVTFVLKDVSGRDVPTIANPRVASHHGFDLQYNPRTQTFRLPSGSATGDRRYVVEAPPDPSGADLVKASAPPSAMREFLQIPAAPAAVQALLDKAPDDNLYDRLQFVRNALYSKAVAAGPGNPVDVSPTRVAQILAGSPASPYEITAADALLARWAGVPSRIGYGYYGGDPISGGHGFSVRPRHGAAWLEAYFDGQGWVPIVGVPQHAQDSLTNTHKKNIPNVRPSNRIALPVFVPVRLDSVRLLFLTVRYYIARLLPIGVAAGFLVWFYPAMLKQLRRRRRRAWSKDHGLPGRLAVAYSEWRDLATDLNVGYPAQTPLEFLEALAPDEEHAEVAWLVTRGMWGDLMRDLGEGDVAAAEQLLSSLDRRLRRGQTPLNRVLASASRCSLREPYSDEMPNAWWSLRDTLRTVGRAFALPHRVVLRAVPLRSSAVLVVLIALLSGCAETAGAPAAAGRTRLPDPLVPAHLGGLSLTREPSAETIFAKRGDAALVETPRVYAIRDATGVQASLQAAVIKGRYLHQRADVRQGVLNAIGSGPKDALRVGRDVLFVVHQPRLEILVWFPPDSSYYQLLVAREGFDAASAFASLLAFQRGQHLATVTTVPQPLDPRRGIEE